MCNVWLASEHAHDRNLGYRALRRRAATLARGDIAAGIRHATTSMYSPHLDYAPDPYLGRMPLYHGAEQALIDQRARWQQAEGGYAHIQGTKPRPWPTGSTTPRPDSPPGLVEKYGLERLPCDVEQITKDELLTS